MDFFPTSVHSTTYIMHVRLRCQTHHAKAVDFCHNSVSKPMIWTFFSSDDWHDECYALLLKVGLFHLTFHIYFFIFFVHDACAQEIIPTHHDEKSPKPTTNSTIMYEYYNFSSV